MPPPTAVASESQQPGPTDDQDVDRDIKYDEEAQKEMMQDSLTQIAPRGFEWKAFFIAC